MLWHFLWVLKTFNTTRLEELNLYIPIARDVEGRSALLISDRRKEKIFSTIKARKCMAKGQCHKDDGNEMWAKE